jgi:hypothetical protein
MTLKKIRRDQLAKFIPDQEVIIRFQQLFQAAGEDNPSLIESGGIDTAAALAAANEIKGVLDSFIQDSDNNLATLEAKINELSCALYLLKESRDKNPPENYHHNISNNDDIDINIVRDYLSSLHDVYIATISDNDLITWDAATNRFVDTSDPIVDTITVNDNVIMSGTTGEGILVDPSAITYSWHDMLGPIVVRGVAATDPSYSIYRGNLRQYQFGLNDTVEITFHVLHDYAPSTDMYIHAHWSHNSAAVTTGSVTWSFEVWYAKGHDQAAFPASKTVTVTQNGSTTQYQHMIAEVAFTNAGGDATHYDRADIEIDGLVIVRIELTANSLNAATDPFLHMCDIHYQSTNIGSKNKAPNFYVT